MILSFVRCGRRSCPIPRIPTEAGARFIAPFSAAARAFDDSLESEGQVLMRLVLRLVVYFCRALLRPGLRDKHPYTVCRFVLPAMSAPTFLRTLK